MGSGLLTPVINQNIDKFVKGLIKQIEEVPDSSAIESAFAAPAATPSLWELLK